MAARTAAQMHFDSTRRKGRLREPCRSGAVSAGHGVAPHSRRHCAMLYMVEMDFRNPAREADWHIWYLQHIAKLIRTVPGFRASQRFRAITPSASPWLAMHDV